MQSIYSPMGSRMPSRKNSFASLRRSLSRRRSRSSLARSEDLERDRDNYGSVVDSGVGMSVSNDERPTQVTSARTVSRSPIWTAE